MDSPVGGSVLYLFGVPLGPEGQMASGREARLGLRVARVEMESTLGGSMLYLFGGPRTRRTDGFRDGSATWASSLSGRDGLTAGVCCALSSRRSAGTRSMSSRCLREATARPAPVCYGRGTSGRGTRLASADGCHRYGFWLELAAADESGMMKSLPQLPGDSLLGDSEYRLSCPHWRVSARLDGNDGFRNESKAWGTSC